LEGFIPLQSIYLFRVEHSMKKKIELLAPGGDVDSIKAAILAGANAVYCGLERFNARNRAENITFDDLNGILRLAHLNDCEVFLTLNIIVVESEIPAIINLLNRLVNTTIDGVIVQDLGMMYLLSHYYKTLTIHASTQLTTHNSAQIEFLNILSATRVNLSRELNLHEIEELTNFAHTRNMLTEVFVHGSNCLSFSGICYLSSVHGGNSGNRGRCSQPCRNQYITTSVKKDFPLNLKDNSAYSDIGKLAGAGVDSIKIEGRIKKFHYVYTVVSAYRKQLQRLYNDRALQSEEMDLYRVFNRDLSNAYLDGNITKDLYIDNPRDHSAIHRSQFYDGTSIENLDKAKGELYDEKTEIIQSVQKNIAELSIDKAPVTLSFSGKAGTVLRVVIVTPETSFVVQSTSKLSGKTPSNCDKCLHSEMLLSRLKGISNTEYTIKHLDLTALQKDLFLPFKELTKMKRKILFHLIGSKEFIDPITVPPLPKQSESKTRARLSLLISSIKDLYLSDDFSGELFFQLPCSFDKNFSEYEQLFTENRRLIPWFESILIGEDYLSALDFLKRVQPDRIVSNNTGIAYAAFQNGIPWIAGPQLNSVNSFTLKCLKEKFQCSAAFLSNEISRNQIRFIKRSDDFQIYYSIYHPINLLTSRQCLFHQVTGCEKNKIDRSCIEKCEKTASITNLKQVSLCIEKSKGNYHSLYNEENFLNTEIVTDIPNLFSSFLVDLRDIQTSTHLKIDKSMLIQLFIKFLAGDTAAGETIRNVIHPSTSTQYVKGI